MTNDKQATNVPLLTGNEVAARLQISRNFAYWLMRQGKIPVVRIGKAVRVRPADLDRFIEQNTTPAAQF